MSVILNDGAVTIKHPKEAEIGELWIARCYPRLVSVVEILELYITIDPMDDSFKFPKETISKYDFYRAFVKVDESNSDNLSV